MKWIHLHKQWLDQNKIKYYQHPRSLFNTLSVINPPPSDHYSELSHCRIVMPAFVYTCIGVVVKYLTINSWMGEREDLLLRNIWQFHRGINTPNMALIFKLPRRYHWTKSWKKKTPHNQLSQANINWLHHMPGVIWYIFFCVGILWLSIVCRFIHVALCSSGSFCFVPISQFIYPVYILWNKWIVFNF